MFQFFKEPEVRLFLRALLAAAITFSTKFVDASGHVTYSAASLHAALVGAGLVFAELFTPLNNIVGIFKDPGVATYPQVATVAVPIEPPGDTTEAPTLTAAKK